MLKAITLSAIEAFLNLTVLSLITNVVPLVEAKEFVQQNQKKVGIILIGARQLRTFHNYILSTYSDGCKTPN